MYLIIRILYPPENKPPPPPFQQYTWLKLGGVIIFKYVQLALNVSPHL